MHQIENLTTKSTHKFPTINMSAPTRQLKLKLIPDELDKSTEKDVGLFKNMDGKVSLLHNTLKITLPP